MLCIKIRHSREGMGGKKCIPMSCKPFDAKNLETRRIWRREESGDAKNRVSTGDGDLLRD